MSRYINAKEIESVIRNDVPLKLLMTNSLNCAIKNGIEIAKIISEKAKPADAVTVVRCKDCKHLMFSDMYGECSQAHMGIVRPDDFCSYGERKDEE